MSYYTYTSPRRPLDVGYAERTCGVKWDFDRSDIGEWSPNTRYTFSGPLTPFFVSQWGLVLFERSGRPKPRRHLTEAELVNVAFKHALAAYGCGLADASPWGGNGAPGNEHRATRIYRITQCHLLRARRKAGGSVFDENVATLFEQVWSGR